jgi:hypothetical protein
MALPYTSGNIIAASFTANVANTTYVFNQATYELPAETVTVTNANGAVTAARVFEGSIPSGTAEIQVNVSGDKGDLRGGTFTTDEFTGTNTNFVITTQSCAITKGEARVYNIGFIKALA